MRVEDRPHPAAGRPWAALACSALMLSLGTACGVPAGDPAPEPVGDQPAGVPAPAAPAEDPVEGQAEGPADPSAPAPAPSASPHSGPAAKPSPAEGVLRIGLPGDRAGLSERDGDAAPRGVEADWARVAAASLGFEPDRIRWQDTTSRSAAEGLADGTLDLAVGGIALSAGDGPGIDVAGPHLALGHDLLVPTDSPIAGPADLGGRTVCAVEGSAALAALTRLLPADADVLTQDGVGECLAPVLSGRADAVVGDEPELAGLSRADASRGGLRLLGTPFGVTSYGVALPEGSTLCATVTAALAEQFADGGWDAAADRIASATGIRLDAGSRAAAEPTPDRCR